MSAVNFIDSVEYTPPADFFSPDDPRLYKVIETDTPLVYKTVFKFESLPHTDYENQSRWGRIKA